MENRLCNEDLERAVSLLEENEAFTCVLVKGEEVYTSDAHGVRALLGWLREGKDLKGFSSADRIVGKAAALLYVKMGIRAIHACTISVAAETVLEGNDISFSYDDRVLQILNRDGSDMCPMEKAVKDTDDPGRAPDLLLEAVKAMSARK